MNIMNTLYGRSLNMMPFTGGKSVIQVKPHLSTLWLLMSVLLFLMSMQSSDSTISVQNSDLTFRNELSASAAFQKRTKSLKTSNVSKLEKAKDFMNLIVDEVKNNTLSSIDETVNSLVLHCPDQIAGMTTVCTKTIYNYVHQGKIDLKPMDLPRMLRRKSKKNDKEYIPKRQKGTPISEKPFEMDDRSEFRHWEGDLVTGPRDGHNGAYLTLLERKTRFYIMIPIPRKSSKQVYMKINQIH